MKLTYSKLMNRKSGVTLLELTVVILVLLLLIGILFIGVNAWKRGADRSSNILNVRNSQLAMRGFQNTRNLAATGTLAPFTSGVDLLQFLRLPVPPSSMGGAYSFTDTVTAYAANPAVAPFVAVPGNLYVNGVTGTPSQAIPTAIGDTGGDFHSPGADVVGW
jgi:type II secretory pathway pseudopilin PulG